MNLDKELKNLKEDDLKAPKEFEALMMTYCLLNLHIL